MERRCSLRDKLYIERADMKAWDALKEFHYRKGHPGAVDKVFAIRAYDSLSDASMGGFSGGDSYNETIGVIIYAMGLVNVAMRNVVTGNRYAGWCDRGAGLALLNREVRWISRVVIHPRYRSMGLASWLVRETLGRAGSEVRLVEAMAVMGKVHPFFERAGMKRYDSVLSVRAVRMRAVFDEVGIDEKQLCTTDGLLKALGRLSKRQREWVVREMRKFLRHNRHYKELSIEGMVEQVVGKWDSNPVYYAYEIIKDNQQVSQAGGAHESG